MTPTDGITDQTTIIPMDIIHGKLKLSNFCEITFLVFLGTHVRGSIIIIPQANTAETAGTTGARGQQRLRSDSVTSRASRG